MTEMRKTSQQYRVKRGSSLQWTEQLIDDILRLFVIPRFLERMGHGGKFLSPPGLKKHSGSTLNEKLTDSQLFTSIWRLFRLDPRIIKNYWERCYLEVHFDWKLQLAGSHYTTLYYDKTWQDQGEQISRSAKYQNKAIESLNMMKNDRKESRPKSRGWWWIWGAKKLSSRKSMKIPSTGALTCQRSDLPLTLISEYRSVEFRG